MVGSRTPRARSAGAPSKLLNIAPSMTKSLYNIVDIVAEVVGINDIVEAFQRDVETRPSSVLR